MGETHIRTEIDIDAPPSVVWEVLTDFSGFHQWNPMVVSAEGPATQGSSVTLHYRSNVGVQLRFRVRITRSDAPRELRWVGSRLGVTGEHYFQLAAEGSGTHFVHGEVFRGPLAGAIGFLFRGQVPVFETFNLALRDVSEHRVETAGAASTGGTGRARP